MPRPPSPLPARPRRRLGLPLADPARRPRARTTATTSSTPRRSTRPAAARRAWTGSPRPAREAGIGILVDIVPNHVGVAQPGPEPVVVGRPHARAAVPLRRGVRHRLGLRRRAACESRSSAPTSTRFSPRATCRSTRCDRPRADGELRYYDEHVLRCSPAGTVTEPGTAPLDDPRRDPRHPRAAALRADLLAPGGGGAELPPVLRRQEPRRHPGGAPLGVRREPTRRFCAGCARGSSTGCGSTTRTAWPTRGGTWSGSREVTGGRYVLIEKILEHGRGAARVVGDARARPATTPSPTSTACSSTRPARRRWTRSTRELRGGRPPTTTS